MILFCELHYREQKIHSNMWCYTQKWVIHWHFNAEWHWLLFFQPDFIAFRSAVFLQQTSFQQTVN